MTREIRQLGDGKTPKYIDHGHVARKAVFYTVCVLVTPLTATQALVVVLNWLFGLTEKWISRLGVWSHPCLYAPRRKRGNDG